MNNKQRLWIYNTCIRAIQSMAQTALATMGTMVTFFDVSWKGVISATLMAGVLSILGSIAKLRPINEPEQGA